MYNSPWILKSTITPKAPRLRLFCFPHSGGSTANYLSWQKSLTSNIEVCSIQLPGRGARFNEENISDFTTLIHSLAPAIATFTDLPYVFFGHSLGALVAFEICHYLKQHNYTLPEHLLVSGANPPSKQPIRPCFKTMSDNELTTLLLNYDGTPTEILEEPMLMELLLPAIRSDFMLLNSYQYHPRHKLPLPLTLMTGNADTNLSKDTLSMWEQETNHCFEHEQFDGGHFYINTEKNKMLKKIETILNLY